jgi:hypothetical protein
LLNLWAMSYQQAPRFVEEIADVNAHRSADAHLHPLIAEIADLVSSARTGTGEPRRIRHRLYVVTADPTPGRHPFDGPRPLVHAMCTQDADCARADMIAHIESTYAWCRSLLHVKKMP